MSALLLLIDNQVSNLRKKIMSCRNSFKFPPLHTRFILNHFYSFHSILTCVQSYSLLLYFESPPFPRIFFLKYITYFTFCLPLYWLSFQNKLTFFLTWKKNNPSLVCPFSFKLFPFPVPSKCKMLIGMIYIGWIHFIISYLFYNSFLSGFGLLFPSSHLFK